MQKRAETDMLRRIMVVTALLGVVAFCAIGVRLFYMQVISYDFYSDKAQDMQTRDKEITPLRGTIMDTNLKPLAISASTEKVTLEAVKVKDDAQGELVAQTLSQLLEMEYSTVKAMVDKKATYVVVKKGVEKETCDLIRAFVKENKLTCIYMVPDAKRYYPFGNFASHVIGFVGSEQQGLNGLEALYEEELKGSPGRVVTATNPHGQEMPFEHETYVDATDGHNVVLTIDEVIQHYVEKNIETAFQDSKVQEYVAGIVLDIKTGGILAMAATPDYDPNNPFVLPDIKQAEIDALTDAEAKKTERSSALSAQWRNHIVSDTYEPGSTFKILTLSMALDEGTVSLNDTFTCSGGATVPGWNKPIRCWKLQGHGTQNLTQAVENSCNPAFITIGRNLGVASFSKYFRAFGLSEKTGIDYPGESESIYHRESKMQEVDLATSSFGQTFQINPVQLLSAVSAVANDGYLMKPHLVKEIRDSQGNVVESYEREPIRQVVSEKTSETVMKILESVVTYGTGKNAYVPGYRVAGKTGTSEKKAKQAITGRDDLRITSFLAVAPADDPKIAVLVLLDEPTARPISGGITAAPVVRKIMEDSLSYLGIEPVYTEAELAMKDKTVPNLTGMTEEAAAAAIKAQGLSYRKIGSGDTVTDQMPTAASTVPSDTQMVLYMGEPRSERMATMPDLTGMNYNTAKNTLKGIEMYISTGSIGAQTKMTVRKQSVAAGTQVPIGSVVIVDMTDPSQGENTT